MNVHELRLPTGTHGEKTKIGPYLRGPINWAWLLMAMRLPGSALKVGLALWHYRSLNKSLTFKKGTNDIAQFLGLSEDTVRRAIDALADVGLIRFDCLPGRKCLITMVEITAITMPNDAAHQGSDQTQPAPSMTGRGANDNNQSGGEP